MLVHLLKSKLHRATVTAASLDYEGSLTIAEDLMERAGLHPYERILCGNMANGARWETYAIRQTCSWKQLFPWQTPERFSPHQSIIFFFI